MSEHLAACQREAEAALTRAFGSGGRKALRSRSRPRSTKAENRRSPVKLAVLREQLLKAVVAKPGETMSILAVEAGSSARELQFPMRQLRQAKQVHSAAARISTCPGPGAEGAATSRSTSTSVEPYRSYSIVRMGFSYPNVPEATNRSDRCPDDSSPGLPELGGRRALRHRAIRTRANVDASAHVFRDEVRLRPPAFEKISGGGSARSGSFTRCCRFRAITARARGRAPPARFVRAGRLQSP